jgi:hypothetical protein
VSSPYILEDPQTGIPRELDMPKLLIGEGKDEVQIFGALLRHLGIDDVRVEDYGGKTKLAGYLDVLRVRPGFADLQALGVTRDADANAVDAFASVSNCLSQREFVAPASSGNVEAGTPRVGIMILPDGQTPGMLEDVCLAALQADSSMRCIDEYFECVRAANGKHPDQIAKARVHAWLAVQDPPDMRLGFATQKGLIDFTKPSFEQLKAFLNAL